jgi:hypothetical protein
VVRGVGYMAPPRTAKREVAEVGLELLYLELVRACPQRPVLDAMGVQVGHQLAERCATVGPEHRPVSSQEHVTPHGHRPQLGFHQHQPASSKRLQKAQWTKRLQIFEWATDVYAGTPPTGRASLTRWR